MHLIVLAQIMTIPFYHLLATNQQLAVGWISLGLFCTHILHLSIKIASVGPVRFLHPTHYERHKEVVEFANKVDLILIAGIATAFILLVTYYSMKLGSGAALKSVSVQAVLSLSIFRVLVFKNDLRDISYMLAHSIRPFCALLVVLFCVVLQAATILQAWLGTASCPWEETKVKLEKDDNFACQYALQEKIADVVKLLLTVFMEDNTNNTLVALKEGLGVGVVYFLLGFWILMGLLFADVLFGMIVTLFGEMYETWREDGKVEVRQPQQKMIQELLLDLGDSYINESVVSPA